MSTLVAGRISHLTVLLEQHVSRARHYADIGLPQSARREFASALVVDNRLRAIERRFKATVDASQSSVTTEPMGNHRLPFEMRPRRVSKQGK